MFLTEMERDDEIYIYILEQQRLSIVTTRFYSYYLVFGPLGLHRRKSSRKDWRERQTDRETDRQTDRDRETERQRQRQRDRETERDRDRQRGTEIQRERFKWYRRCPHVQFCHR